MLEEGKKYMIFTVTKYYTGVVLKVYDIKGVPFVELGSAAWIPDTGRFFDALKSGQLKEVEPYPTPTVSVAVGSIVDFTAWTHALPTKQV